ncbi:MAG: seg [Parcubacteria group bacterium]|nr:seg [Parcubacteria group bacterium]
MEPDSHRHVEIKNPTEGGISSALRFFQGDEKFVFIFKKSQKLVSALYLVTGFFPDAEPLKWKLRSLGSKLLSSSIFLKDTISPRRDKAVLDIRDCVLEVTALFAVAKQSGMVSPMNFDIINREFSLLLDSIALAGESAGDNSGEIKGDFFAEKPALQTRPSPISEDSSSMQSKTGVPEIKDKSKESFSAPIPHTGLLDVEGGADQLRSSVLKGQKSENSFKEFGAVAVKKNSRQSVIINLLKRKKEIMIKDVSPLIEGCSEKTIQRELLAMVHSGILRKEGEKRWSRYSLARA